MNTVPLTLLRDFNDWLSPMLVKELRHGLRTRAFTSLLTSFQLGMILVVGSGVMGVSTEVISNIFWTLTLTALLLALPLRGFGTLSGEAVSGTMDMLTLTSISSFRIVYGKWLALFSQTLLLASSLLPYMVARYYLGGAEIVREGLALLLAVLASAVATAAYVAVSSQRSLILRLFVTCGILFSLLPVTIVIFQLINDVGGELLLDSLQGLATWEIVGIFGCVLLMSLYAGFTFLAMAASRIAPLSENHSTWKRLIHLGMLALLTLAGCALAFHDEQGAVLWAFVPSFFMTLLVGMDVMTEDMPRFPSVLEGVMKRGGPLGRLLYPGWAGGVMFYCLLGVLNVTILLVSWNQHPQHDFHEVVIVCSCLLIACMLPVCLRVNKTNLFANWWVVQMIMGVFGLLLGIFRGITNISEAGFLGVITPITGLFGTMDNYKHEEALFSTTLAFSLCWLAACLVVAAGEAKQYRLLETEAQRMSPAGPHSPDAAL